MNKKKNPLWLKLAITLKFGLTELIHATTAPLLALTPHPHASLHWNSSRCSTKSLNCNFPYTLLVVIILLPVVCLNILLALHCYLKMKLYALASVTSVSSFRTQSAVCGLRAAQDQRCDQFTQESNFESQRVWLNGCRKWAVFIPNKYAATFASTLLNSVWFRPSVARLLVPRAVLALSAC